MKKISNLKGIKVLTKEHQKEINGGIRFYCKTSTKCCTYIQGFGELCEPCYCDDNGGYILL